MLAGAFLSVRLIHSFPSRSMNRFSGLLIAAVIVLFPQSTNAQIQSLGSEATLDIATWNIEWFGSSSNGPSDDARQVQNVADIISGSGIDIWAVQEIVDVNRGLELDAMLPDYWEGILATDSGQQKIGFMWDSRVLQLRNSTHILQSFDYEFAGRPPLKAEFQVTLPDTSFVATFITVHMKAFGDQTSYGRRVEAAKRIKNHIDFTALSTETVFFLGDFNDEMTASTYNGEPSPYVPFLEDTDDYAVLSWPLEQAGGSTHQSGSFLDHIVVTNEANDMWLRGSTRVMTNLVTVNSFYARTSDHLPVMASFGSSTVTSTESPESLPERIVLSSPWPNPSTGAVSVTYEGHDPHARIVLQDILGRVVREVRAESGTNRLELSQKASGLYFIRLISAEGVFTRRVVLSGGR